MLRPCIHRSQQNSEQQNKSEHEPARLKRPTAPSFHDPTSSPLTFSHPASPPTSALLWPHAGLGLTPSSLFELPSSAPSPVGLLHGLSSTQAHPLPCTKLFAFTINTHLEVSNYWHLMPLLDRLPAALWFGLPKNPAGARCTFVRLPGQPNEWCRFEFRVQATPFKSWRNFSGQRARTCVLHEERKGQQRPEGSRSGQGLEVDPSQGKASERRRAQQFGLFLSCLRCRNAIT